jgi:hypothetical protein
MNNQQFVKLIILSALILCFCSLIHAKKIANFPGINKPYRFEVYDNDIYIGEKSSISIYSLKDFTLIKKFGRRGEGPGEFKALPMFKIFSNYIVVNNFTKWLLFSRKGEFIEEKRDTLFKLFLYPVGSNYVATTLDPNPKIKNAPRVVSLLDKNLEPIKEIFRKVPKGKGKRRRREMIRDFYKYRVYEDKIFLGDTSKGFFIEVFNSNGNKLYEIKKKYQPLKVTEKYKKDKLKREKESNDFVSNTMRKLKYKYKFRDYFPAFRDLRVKDGKIYVFTDKSIEDQGEVIVMDLKGNILKKTFVSRAPWRLYSISNDRYYFLKDNLEKEEWELFAEDIQHIKIK